MGPELIPPTDPINVRAYSSSIDINPRLLKGYTMLNPQVWVLFLCILQFAQSLHANEELKSHDPRVKTAVYHTAPFVVRPGLVVDTYYLDVAFPKGHIALKSFNGEIVDETGTPVPLYETYIHHWALEPYYAQKGIPEPIQLSSREFNQSMFKFRRNKGVCRDILGHYYGSGSETRRTSTWIPGNYGIELAKPDDIPEGYEERWMLNLHAIDTRGAVDRMGCGECNRNLYNVTVDTYGKPLSDDYIGGFLLCYHNTQCLVKPGFNGVERKLYLRYTVMWTDWDDSINLPVKVYILDVTGELINNSTYETCKNEYEVLQCKGNNECVDVKKTELIIQSGGDLVYGVAHQHTGGIGSTLYGQDGRVICDSNPSYGDGKEAGNEAGYLVGMSSCYPEPGSVRIADGELLTIVSHYNNSQQHTGVMGLFYIYIADPQEKHGLASRHNIPFAWEEELPKHSWAFFLIAGLAAVMVGLFYHNKGRQNEGYQPLVVV